MADLDREQVYELTESLKELNQTFKVFSSTGGATDRTGAPTNPAADPLERSTQKIVNALGLLGAQLTSRARSEAQKTREINAFTASVEKATKVQNESITAAKKAAATAQEAVDFEARIQAARARMQRLQDEQVAGSTAALAKLARETEAARKKKADADAEAIKALERSGGNANYLSAEFDKLTTGSVRTKAGLKALGATVEAATKSVSQYASAIYRGERGALTSAKAISTFTNGFAEGIGNVISVLSWFVPGGIFVKGLVAITGQLIPKLMGAANKYNELASEQADKLYTTFQELSKSGVSAAGGIDEVFTNLQQAGMTVSEIGEFTKLLGSSAKDLKFLGTSAGAGAKAFTEVAGGLYKSDLGRGLELLGVSAEEQRESALAYMSIQSRTGQLQLGNTQQLIKSSAEFTKEMDLAAQLAGNTRKEQIEAREAAMKDFRFRSAMQEAVESGDQSRIDELKLAEYISAQLKGAGDEEGATGVMQAVTGRGALSTDAAIKANMQYGGGDLYGMLRGGNKKDAAEFMSRISKNAGTLNRQMSGINQVVGETGLQTTGVGSFEQVARDRALDEGMREAKFTGTRREFLETEQGKKIVEASAKTAAAADTRRAQQSAAMMEDAIINSFYDVSKINKDAAELFNKAVQKFGEKAGAVVAGGTPTTSAAPSTPSATPATSVKPSSSVKPSTTPAVAQKQADSSMAAAQSAAKDSTLSPEQKKAALQKSWEDRKALGEAVNPSPAPSAKPAKSAAAIMDPKLKESLTSGGINDTRAQANILAQIQAESGGDATKSENLKYTPLRLMAVFPKKFKNIQDAQQVSAAGEQAIGDRIYGGRMGNTEQGDGYKYRGRGLIQLTGKDNYKKFSDLVGVDLVKNPDLAADPDIARKIAVAYFKEKQRSGVDLSDSKQVSKAVGHVDIDGKESDRRAAAASKIETALAQKPAEAKPTTALAQKPADPKQDIAKSLNDILTFGSDSGSQQAFSNLEESFKSRVVAAAESFNKLTGNKIQINSAHRSDEDQPRLYDEWVKGGQRGTPVAKPGTSLHNQGLAVDIQNYADPVAVKAFNEQGLSQKVKDDPVHFQARTGGIFKGPTTGYNVELHGDEAVVPMNEGVSKQALDTSVFNQDTQLLDSITSMMAMMSDKYDQLIDLMSRNVDNGEKLVNATV